MRKYINFIILISISLVFSNERVFQLKSGNKITGKIIEIDEGGNYKVLTSVGEVSFNSNDIIPERVNIFTKDGDKIIGILNSEDNSTFYVKSNIGTLSINKSDVKSIEFDSNVSEDAWESDISTSDNKYYFGDERLIDLWFDPTGNVLPMGTIYISGLSIAYGLSEKLQFNMNIWKTITGYFNVRGKYQIYNSGSIDEKINTVSLGGHFFINGSPGNKWDYTYTRPDACGDLADCEDIFYEPNRITTDESSYEIFIAASSSKLKSSQKGRNNFNIGLSTTIISGYDPMLRAWIGTDFDVRKKIKLLALLAYDEYGAPTIARLNRFENKTKPKFTTDIGFVYSLNQNFKVGLHITSPWIGFYWKF